MKCPCKDCDRRKLLCHSFCKEYHEFVAWREEVREKRQKEGANIPTHKRGRR